MIKLLFLSHPQSSEPPMAYFIMKELVKKAYLGSRITIDTARLTKKGSPLNDAAQAELAVHQIPTDDTIPFALAWKTYEDYDFILTMDDTEENELFNTIGGDVDEKIHILSDYAKSHTAIPNPTTGTFWDDVYETSVAGCQGLLEKLEDWIR